MAEWPKNPVIYEINTWVWLYELSKRYKQKITLDNVPVQEWNKLKKLGIDAIWFMGVWERSPEGKRISTANEMLREAFQNALPDYEEEDNLGSAYCVRRYEVDERLGGKEGLAAARRELLTRQNDDHSRLRAKPCCPGPPLGNRTPRVLHTWFSKGIVICQRFIFRIARGSDRVRQGSQLPCLAGHGAIECFPHWLSGSSHRNTG